MANLKQNNKYGLRKSGPYHYYSKIESSGCTTKISLRSASSGSSFFALSHYGKGEYNYKERENVEEIAQSFYAIIKHFKLEEKIKLQDSLSINIGARISHEPLIRFINEDKTWPENMYLSAKKTTTNKHERFVLYKKQIRQVMIESKIYNPFMAVMEKIGCNMSLSDNCFDGLFIERDPTTKEMLIEGGVFSKEEAKKAIYPYIKGYIAFDINQM